MRRRVVRNGKGGGQAMSTIARIKEKPSVLEDDGYRMDRLKMGKFEMRRRGRRRNYEETLEKDSKNARYLFSRSLALFPRMPREEALEKS